MLTGLLLLAFQIPEWIERLKHSGKHVEPVRLLGESDPALLIPALAQAIDADPDFAPGKDARQHAFEAASLARTVLGEGLELRRVVRLEAHVRLLERGTRESTSAIRRPCAQSIRDWSHEWQGLALEVLRRTLADVDPVVRLESCRSVSPWGAAAEPLMPQLDLLLVGVSADGKPLSWIRADGLFREEDNYELWQRKEAALARMHVKTIDVDRERWSRLDPIGQDALCSAWSHFALLVIEEHLRTREESPAFLRLKQNVDLLLRPLERPGLFSAKEKALNDMVVGVIYYADQAGLLGPEHRELARSRASALLARDDLAPNQRERLEHLRKDFGK